MGAVVTLYLSLLCHLVGDYPLQAHAMAVRKTSSWTWAGIHATFYSLPFAALALLSGASLRWLAALAIIGGTHAAIDRLGIARRWCQWYGVGFPGLWWRPSECECGHPLHAHTTGRLEITGASSPVILEAGLCGGSPLCSCRDPRPKPFDGPPPFLGVWLIIIVDNTFHLLINTAAILWATHASP